jgi:hypothetical protein
LRLELENDTAMDDPTPEAIAQALGTLGQKGNSFAILYTEEGLTLIQTTGSPKTGFVLEYQEQTGSKTQIYQPANHAIPLPEILAAFQDFAVGGTAWKTRFQWVEEKPSKSGCFSVLLLFAATITGAVLLK